MDAVVPWDGVAGDEDAEWTPVGVEKPVEGRAFLLAWRVLRERDRDGGSLDLVDVVDGAGAALPVLNCRLAIVPLAGVDGVGEPHRVVVRRDAGEGGLDLAVLAVPTTTVYGVWRGKDGQDWQDERLKLDCRGSTMAPTLAGDLEIVEAYEEVG